MLSPPKNKKKTKETKWREKEHEMRESKTKKRAMFLLVLFSMMQQMTGMVASMML
jgi:hypothetical protein